ncbi:TPA: hypothetical protein MW242_002614 [Acinetobacter baumannii]|nr:hypothetical protein [Acinetobacter baumannii]
MSANNPVALKELKKETSFLDDLSSSLNNLKQNLNKANLHYIEVETITVDNFMIINKSLADLMYKLKSMSHIDTKIRPTKETRISTILISEILFSELPVELQSKIDSSPSDRIKNMIVQAELLLEIDGYTLKAVYQDKLLQNLN